MFLNKAKLRKASSRVALLLATGSLLATGIAPAQALDATPLYINFEASDPLKNVGAAGGAFGGSSFEVKAGTNLTTGDSLHFTKNGQPWGGVNILKETSTPYGYTAADKKVVTFTYWSPDAVASPVMLKLEAPAATLKAVEAQPGLNQISVDFTGVASWGGGYTKLIIFPNFGSDDASYTGAPAVPNTGQVYEIDNISINGGTAADVYVPQAIATSTLVTFEANDTLGAGVVGEASGAKKQGSFAGTATTIEDAPTGGNGGKALKIVKNGEPFAGVNVLSFEPATTRVTNATHKTVTFNYHSSKADSPVRIELRGHPNALGKTVTAPLGWSKITVDFTDVAGWTSTEVFANVILFPDFDVAAAGDVFYVDNLGINGATTPAIPVGRSATSTLLTFETGDTLGAAAAGPGFEGAVSVIKDAAAGGNGGKALEIEKAGQPWAGINLATAPANVKFLDATNKTVTMNYYSPQTVATPVQFQFEATDGSKINQAVEAAPGWSKLTIDFTASYNDAKQYTIARIYPNFASATEVPGYTGAPAVLPLAPVKFYFVDNVGFNGASTPGIPVPGVATSTLVTFETSDTLGAGAVGEASGAKKQGSFAGSVTTIEDAPAGGNGGKALKIVKNGLAYAGVNVLIFEPGTIRVTNGTHKTITFNYHSSKADSPVRIELRGYPNALGKTVTAPLGWSKITVDFTDVAGWTSTEEYLSVVLFPDYDVPAAGNIFYVDNLGINGASTPAIPVPVTPREATNTLLTFESGDVLGAAVEGAPTVQKPTGGFEGATTSIVAAPAGGNGGNALKITKNLGAQIYAGATLIKFGTDKRVTNGTHKTITFNYYSPKANSPVNVELRAYPNALGKIVNAPLGWSKITVDFTAVVGWTSTEEFTLLSIFPDFNQPAGDVAQSYYVDNVAFNGAVTPEIPSVPVVRDATSTLVTFETGDTLGAKVDGVSTNAKPEGGFEGALTTIENAPAGGNGGKALKIVKNGAAYAGANIIKFGADKRVTNGTYKTITFNYYSPKANSPTRVELRGYPNALGKTVTAPLGWSKITVDFTDVVGWTSTEEFVSVVLFPDFDVAATGAIFYVDNLAFNGATTPSIPVVVVKVKPSVKTAATVAGTAKSAKTLTAGKGSWNGTATIAYTYKWYRCSVSSTKTATAAPTSSAKCATISGATKSTYKLASADVGKYVRVLITAKNSAGTAYSLSKTTSKVVK